MSIMTTAIVIVSSEHLLPDVGRGVNYGLARGYHVVSVIKDNWKQAVQMLNDGAADVLIVADPHHLTIDQEPRVEIATIPPEPSGSRRPRVVG